ncbi:MAG: long-chain fatty acid--CoA ligase [Actinomycetia bacterium]|nr:long-chain fatty acid--CoA ligase [Actinomycetes bacterium]
MHELVAVDLRPGKAFIETLARAWEAGDAVLPLQQEAPLSYRRGVAESLGATRWVDSSGEQTLPGGWPVGQGDALVVATSGTTGHPKGAVLTHDAVSSAAFATSTALGVAPDVHWLCCLPLSHVAGLSIITRSWQTGAGLTVHDGLDPAAVDDAARSGATHVSLVPTALGRIDATLWRRILLGGSAVPEDRPPNAVAGYGMTETYGGVVYDGLPLPGVELRIQDAGSRAPGASGPIELRTASLLRCYRDGSVPMDADGWYPTGDIGSVDPADGRLSVEGRGDDLIITGGEKVWPEPVEKRLELHPDIAEAGVYGRPDDEWGARVCAWVVPADAGVVPSLDELRDWVRSTLPTSAAPKEVLAVASLPRTSLGKLRRSSLAVSVSDDDEKQGGADGG